MISSIEFLNRARALEIKDIHANPESGKLE